MFSCMFARTFHRVIQTRFDPARKSTHNYNSIGKKCSLIDGVGDEKNGSTLCGVQVLSPNAQQFALEYRAGLRVKSAQRLVHQENVRIGCEGPSKSATLLHSA